MQSANRPARSFHPTHEGHEREEALLCALANWRGKRADEARLKRDSQLSSTERAEGVCVRVCASEVEGRGREGTTLVMRRLRRKPAGKRKTASVESRRDEVAVRNFLLCLVSVDSSRNERDMYSAVGLR